MRVPLLAITALLLGLAVTYIAQHDARPVVASGGPLAIALGDGHTCAVRPDTGVRCWGRNDAGQLGDGTNDPSTIPVDVCVTGTGVDCGGGERLTGIVDVAAGFAHTCALTESGGVMCWGSNVSGQLGDGTTDTRSHAGSVCATGMGSNCTGGESLSGVVQMDSGSGFNCALMEDTGIKCWGNDDVGQLGIGTPVPAGSTAGGFGGHETHPVDVCDAPLVVGIEAGELAGLIIIPPACVPLTGFTAVTTGGEHACALLESSGAQCWGAGDFGRLGNGADDTFTSPVDVCGPPPIMVSGPSRAMFAGIACFPVMDLVAIDAGDQHTCAVTDQGLVTCWGRNFSGQLGDGTKEDRFSPRNVCASGSGQDCTGGTRLIGIAALGGGSGYHCAIDTEGDVSCWGTNFDGQLGNDSAVAQSENPVEVTGLPPGVALLQGGSRALHVCAAPSDGSLRCWGSNFHGQLGNGPADSNVHALPELVGGFAPKATATPTNTPVPVTNTPTNTPPPGATNTPTPTPPAGGLIGDVDCNGVVNAIDAAYILQYVAGLLPALPCPENADTNDDGNINSIDSALILQYVAGLLPTLPP